MKKLLFLVCFLPIVSFSQTLNLVEKSIDSLRSYIPVISSIMGVQLKENTRPHETYPIIFGDKESGNYVITTFINKQITGGKEIVNDIKIYGASDKIDSLFLYFRNIVKSEPSFMETAEGVGWGNTAIYKFEESNSPKLIRIRIRSPKKTYQ